MNGEEVAIVRGRAAAGDRDVTAGISISVALVTRNRPGSLTRTLSSLRAQSEQPYQVIVSDDSDDSIARAVQSIATQFDCDYERGPRRGLYANRNAAAMLCTGSHIRTMDDDHEFPPGHTAVCLAAVGRDPEAVWIVGEFLPDDQGASVAAACPPQLHPRGFSVTPPAGDSTIWSMADGASICPRSLFDRGVRYVDDFIFGASYLEWGSRLQWLGYRIRHLRDTYVIHHLDIATRSFRDPETDLTARMCAMLLHSFVYQPSLRNRLLTSAEIGRQLVTRPFMAGPAFRRAHAVFSRRRNEFQSLRARMASRWPE